jgi:hypothetical protein
MNFEKGAPVPDMPVFDLSGQGKRLSGFRRKEHVILVNEAPDRWEKLRGEADADRQRWTWLKVAFVRPADGSKLAPGTYVVSRWGNFLEFYATGAWDFDKIEKDLLYFEASDCCDLKDAP